MLTSMGMAETAGAERYGGTDGEKVAAAYRSAIGPRASRNHPDSAA